MGIFSKLFSSSEVVGDVIEGAGKAADALHYSQEEKASHVEKMYSLYEPFKLAQRYLALIFAVPFVGVITLSALVYASSAFFDPCDTGCKSAQLQLVAKELISIVSSALGTIVMIVTGFYFAGGTINTFAGKIRHSKE